MLVVEDAKRPDDSGLADFSRRLDEARGRRETDGAGRKEDAVRGRALGQGFRLASELIAAVLVGLLLGLGVDRVAGTSPFGLLGGLFVGFAAGFRNAVRTMLPGTTAASDGEGKKQTGIGAGEERE